MNTLSLTFPEVALIAGTRAALGAGVALLLSDRMDTERRRAVGWTLVAVGALSTLPLALQALRSKSPCCSQESAAGRLSHEGSV